MIRSIAVGPRLLQLLRQCIILFFLLHKSFEQTFLYVVVDLYLSFYLSLCLVLDVHRMKNSHFDLVRRTMHC